MDTLEGLSSSMNHLQFDNGRVSIYSDQNFINPPPQPPFLHINPNPTSDSILSSGMSSDGDSPDIGDLSCTTLKYISEMLMEEDLDSKTCMLQDCLALQAAEKSFYDVLGQEYPPSLNQPPSCFNEKDLWSLDDYCTTSGSVVSRNLVERQGEFKSSFIDSPESTLLVQNLYSVMPPSEQVNNGVPLKSSPSKPREEVVGSTMKDGIYNSSYGSRGRKFHQIDDWNDLGEERNNKHSALSPPESKPLEMFDEVLLCNCKDENRESVSCLVHGLLQNGSGGKVQQTEQSRGSSNGGTTRKKKKGKKKEFVDLWTLLTLCAQAVASYDQRTANELLMQIRQHSSSSGDGTQRLAHYFANGLEARLAGTQTPIRNHFSTRASAADILHAYKVYVTSCPFNRMSFFMANRTILKLFGKATSLHIIDFGIGYGFQWPCLIQRISRRDGGPPKLRITGIELPQSGFRPSERVEETVQRLKCYCERFNVPFEYNAIAQKWQTIQLEDLKIDKEDMIVVNCLYRMRNLPDDTVVIKSPRDAVLELIKKINPDLFIHGVVNGSHNAPFFLPRFREALFHFSSLFDMFEANVPREDQGRMMFEREIYGKDAMNVIACEGIERIERPETYKQWQARNQRIGFRQLPLDKDILKRVKAMVKSNFHPDFVVDEVGHWMLQGWKGRIAYALSFWKPVQE